MSRAGTDHARLAAVERAVIKVAADEPSSETEPAQGLDHEPCVVATRA